MRTVQLCTYFLTWYMASSVLLMTPVQILFRTSAQKMYGRSHEQSVSPSGTAGEGWGNPRAEVSEQCCHHYGHYYSRFACQLQLHVITTIFKILLREINALQKDVSTQRGLNEYPDAATSESQTETTSMDTTVWSSVGMTTILQKKTTKRRKNK